MKTTPAPAVETVSSVTVSIEIPSPYKKVFSIVSDPFQFPQWAKPIKSVRRTESGSGIEFDYELPAGPTPCSAKLVADEAKGTIDYAISPPDGPRIEAHAQVIPLAEKNTRYVFTLESPPMPKRKLKNPQEVLRKNLTQDLDNLRSFILTGRKKS